MHAATSAKVCHISASIASTFIFAQKQKEYIDTLQAEIDVLQKRIGLGRIIDLEQCVDL